MWLTVTADLLTQNTDIFYLKPEIHRKHELMIQIHVRINACIAALRYACASFIINQNRALLREGEYGSVINLMSAYATSFKQDFFWEKSESTVLREEVSDPSSDAVGRTGTKSHVHLRSSSPEVRDIICKRQALFSRVAQTWRH